MTPNPAEKPSDGRWLWAVTLLATALAAAAPALGDITIQSGSASLTAQGTDFFAVPGHQTVITAPDPTNFTNTAEVSFNGHGSVHMDVATSQATQAQINGDNATITSTQSFSILHMANDADRENLLSHTESTVTITFCTTKKSSFLFTASGQMAVPSDKGTSGSFRGHPFADGLGGAFFICNGLCPPGVTNPALAIGVNFTGGPNNTAPQPNGSTQGSGTIPPGCYEFSASVAADLTSPLLCHNTTGICQRFQIPPDINNSPPTANGSVTATLTVTPTSSTNDDEITWVGPDNGAFGDPTNWSPQQVPTITPDESDTAIFSSGGTVDVDVAADAPSASDVVLLPRQTASRSAGRLRAKGVKDLFVKDFNTLVLDDVSLDKASVVVGNRSKLHVAGGTVIGHNARLGDGGPGTLLVDPQSFFDADLLAIGGGAGSDGTLQVRNGGQSDVTEVRIGNGAGLGTATIDGDGSRLTTGKISVGFAGHGELLVQNGGEVDSTTAIVDAGLPPAPPPTGGSVPTLCIGRSGGGGVDVIGSANNKSSAWHVDSLDVGGLGCVEATSEGGIVTGEHAGGDVRVGTTTAGEADVFVNHGGVLSVGGNLVVGESGHGKLVVVEDVLDDPRVNVTGALSIGESLPPAGTGQVIVVGDPQTTGASLNVNAMHVPDGDAASGDLDIRTGGRITTTTTADIGANGTESASGAVHGFGAVHLTGAPGADAGLTRWIIGTSLTIGGTQPDSSTGHLDLSDASVVVGTTNPSGVVTINAGGRVTGFGQSNLLVTNGGTIHNDGVVAGPVVLGGSYDASSHGSLVQALGASPIVVPTLGTRGGVLAAGGGGAGGPPPPAQGPIVITGDADLGNTTLVLQFVNGFAPKQGDAFPVVEVQGQRTGTFAGVQVVGLAPGASFAVDPQTGTATSQTDTVALPVVTMKAPKTLKESAKKGGKIKFARSGATTNPLIVNLGVGGTADPAIDYGLLPSTVTIPAKKKSVTLVVVPFADGLIEPPETIELTVLPGDGYQTTSTPTATITLLSTEKKPKK